MKDQNSNSGRRKNLQLVDNSTRAPVMESVDITDLKSVVRKGMPVQVWPGAPRWRLFKDNYSALRKLGLDSTDTSFICDLIDEETYRGHLDQEAEKRLRDIHP